MRALNTRMMLCLTASSISAAALLPAAAFGQTAPLAVETAGQTDAASPNSQPDTVATDQDDSRLADIVVTAQKRSQSAQRVPISIAALGSEDIVKYGINDVYDLRGTTSSLQVRRSTAFGNPTMIIRGIGSTSFDTISSAVVANYVDDVPVVSIGQLNFTAFDLQGIEVLKGPQGTLFGSGTTAGVVLFTSARPTTTLDGYLRIEGGNYGTFSAEGAISGPIAENVSGRISGRVERTDGYYTNIANGHDAGGQRAAQIRGQLLWEEGDNSVLLSGRYQHSDARSTLYDKIPLLENNGAGVARTCGVIQAAKDRGKLLQSDVNKARAQCVDIYGARRLPAEGPYKNFSRSVYGDDAPIKLDTFGFNMRANLALGDKTLTSITGFDRTSHGGADPEGPGLRAGSTDVFWRTNVLAFSQEMRLSSSPAATNKWIIGFNVLANRIENDLRSQFTFASFGAEGAPFINETPQETLNGPGRFLYSSPQTQDTIDTGIFGQVDWKLSDTLTLVTGLREGWYRKKDEVSSLGLFDLTRTEVSQFNTSFNLGLNYTPSRDVLLYAKVSQGVKSGTHVGGFKFSADQAPPAEQETLRSYEAGFKTQFFDRSLQLNGALFYYDYMDLQSLTQRLVNQSFVQRYTNIGDARIIGAEFEATWAPTRSILIKGGGTYLDTKVTRTEGDVLGSFNGNRLGSSPKFSGNWLARYTLDGPGGSEISLQYDGNYDGGQFRNVDNSYLDWDEATTKHNANVTFTSGDRKWEASVWGRNLTNELDFTWQFTFGGVQHRSYLAPRTYGATLTRRF